MSRYLRIFLLIVILVAAFLRLVDIGENPPGFFRDEADKGYTAYCLLKTGKDLAGHTWPLFVKSLSVYTSGIYQYTLIPFIALGGLNESIVRLPAALVGIATVLLTFLIGRKLYDEKVGLLAAIFLTFSPWHLVFSRWANQGIFLPLLVLLGLYFFLSGEKRWSWSSHPPIPPLGKGGIKGG